MNFDTSAKEQTGKGRDMQTSTASTAPSVSSGSTNTLPVKSSPVLNWTLQRLNRTWFLFEGQVLRIEKKAEDGASDEQWRAFLASNSIRLKNDDGSKPWGPLARRDFLNWLENEYPDRMPAFFDSKEAASKALEESKNTVSKEPESKSESEQTWK